MRAAARSERNETYKQRLSESCGNIASYCRDRREKITFLRKLQALSAVLEVQVKGRCVHAVAAGEDAFAHLG